MPANQNRQDSGSSESNRSVSNARATAEKAIASAVHSREVVRGTRLRRQVERLVEKCHSTPPKSPAEAARVLDELLREVMTCCEAPMGNLQVAERSGPLRICVHHGFQKPFLEFFSEVHDGAACATAFAQSTPVAIDDVATSPVYSPAARDVMLAAGAVACQSVALVPRGRKKLGVLSVHYRERGIPEERKEMLATLAPQIAKVVELCTPA